MDIIPNLNTMKFKFRKPVYFETDHVSQNTTQKQLYILHCSNIMLLIKSHKGSFVEQSQAGEHKVKLWRHS